MAHNILRALTRILRRPAPKPATIEISAAGGIRSEETVHGEGQ